MRLLLFAAVMLASAETFAQENVVKQCAVQMKQLDSEKLVRMTVRVIDKSGTLSAVITQNIEGQAVSYDDVAEVRDEPVRPNLSPQTNSEDLNQAERLIVHAMTLAEEPVFEGSYSAGLELGKVRSAKTYTVGDKTGIGITAIVEACDSDGHLLGSFLGGFLVSPCE